MTRLSLLASVAASALLAASAMAGPNDQTATGSAVGSSTSPTPKASNPSGATGNIKSSPQGGTSVVQDQEEEDDSED